MIRKFLRIYVLKKMNIFDYPFIFRELNKYLTDKDKINLISTNKFLNNKKSYFLFDKYINHEDKLENKWYYNSIMKIKIDKIFKLPERLKCLRVVFKSVNEKDASLFSNMIPRTVEKINLYYLSEHSHFISPSFPIKMKIGELNKNIILNNITELKILELASVFNDLPRYKKLIINDFWNAFLPKIPDSVEHLELSNVGSLFPEIIPNSVKFLKLCIFNGVNLKNAIPNSVKYLTLRCGNINQDVEGCIPSSVTHLNVQNLKDFVVPQNVTHLTFCDARLLETVKMTSVINLTLVIYRNSTKPFIDIPVCVVHLTIFDRSLNIKLNLNNVKFLVISKRYYEFIKDCISEEVKVSYLK